MIAEWLYLSLVSVLSMVFIVTWGKVFHLTIDNLFKGMLAALPLWIIVWILGWMWI